MFRVIRRFATSVFSLTCVLSLPYSAAQEPEFSADQIDFFENKIRPLLVEHCLECHGNSAEKLRGGLKLTSRDEILSGGDSGPAAVSGAPEKSLLISSIHYEDYEMPPTGQLPRDKIKDLITWVEMGLPDPRGKSQLSIQTAPSIDEGRSYWAFQRPRKPGISMRQNDAWSRTNIDRLILEKWREHKLTPVPDADRIALVRRIYLTLSGLPPTVNQIDQFVGDQRDTQTVVTALIDELLKSPQFGERWGRHWLDVARFAESSGGGRSLMFPNAWRYRDYVIQAFNTDKPYHEFVKEQIAGDLMPYDSFDQRTQRIIATGFLTLGPTNYEQQDKELLRMEVIDEQVDTVGRTFLGMTLGCARCHDHKFDPIPMSDYYAIAGIFGSTKTLVDGNVSGYVEQTIATEQEVLDDKQYRQKIAKLSRQLAEAKKAAKAMEGDSTSSASDEQVFVSKDLPGIVIDDSMAEKIGQWKASTSLGPFVDRGYVHDIDNSKGKKKVVFKPKLKTGGRYEVRMSYSPAGNRASNVPVTIDHQDGRTIVKVNQSQKPPLGGLFVSLGAYRFEADNLAAVTISNDDTDGHVIVDAIQFIAESDRLAKETNNTSEKKPTFDNDHEPEISPKLQKIHAEINRIDALLKEEKSRTRKPLAKAMAVTDVDKPGDGHIHIRGEVRNLGEVVPRGFLQVACLPGDQNPGISSIQSGRLELAQWIASADNPLTARVYVNRIWRHLFGKGLVPSPDNFGAMGFAPTHPELLDYLAIDFIQNGWSTKTLIKKIMLSRVWQLSTDHHRDAFKIDDQNQWLWRFNRRRLDAEVLRDSILAVSGKLDLTAGGLTIRKITQYDLGYKFDTSRRSIYVPTFRNSMLEIFEVFDFANPNLVVGDRNTSTLPTQALYLMNSPFVLEQSRYAAHRILDEKDSMEGRIEFAYRRFLGRHPTKNEVAESKLYIETASEKSDLNELDVWSNFCHALFASLDFRYMN